jgi:hypothetical protein
MNSDSNCDKIQILSGSFLKSTAMGDMDSSEKIISLINENDLKHFIEHLEVNLLELHRFLSTEENDRKINKFFQKQTKQLNYHNSRSLK